MQKVETGTESIAKQDYSGKKKEKCSLGKEWVERWKGNYHLPSTHYVPGVCLHRLLILRCPAQQAQSLTGISVSYAEMAYPLPRLWLFPASGWRLHSEASSAAPELPPITPMAAPP